MSSGLRSHAARSRTAIRVCTAGGGPLQSVSITTGLASPQDQVDVRYANRSQLRLSPALAPISSVSIGPSHDFANSRKQASNAIERRVSFVWGADLMNSAT